MMKRIIAVGLLVWGSLSIGQAQSLPKDVLAKLNNYNVSWNTLSTTGSLECMPLGNGDITVNAWVEQEGDLMLYIGKSDTWSEATRLLKVGRVRVHLSPNPFTAEARYLQVLRLADGAIDITADTPQGKQSLKVWVDANRPVVRVDVQSSQKIAVECTTELMRPVPYTLLSGDDPLAGSFRGVVDGPVKPSESADKLLRRADRVEWVHRNETSFYLTIMKYQNVPHLAEKYPDPYLNRTFGAAMAGKHLKPANDSTLVSVRPEKEFHIAIYPYTAQTATLKEWENRLADIVAEVDAVDRAKAYKEHTAWWRNFWNRSWIFLSGDEDAEKATRAWLLQRFMIACQSRGAYPVKFNGGSLTFDYKGMNGDFRRWGGGYWHQNCRLYYWPLLASGDFDMMKPWFDMYMNMLPLQMDVTRSYYGHDGAFYPETLNFFGMFIQDDWGWNNQGKASQTRWIRYHYSGTLEMTAMMLDYYQYTRDEQFAKDYLIPFATQAIRFFDRHWTRINQTLNFVPANSLEQFWDCLNPVDYIAGLQYTIRELKKLPEGMVDTALLEEWSRCERSLPALPIRDGRILPAEEYGVGRNFENPELYTIFPFRLYGIGYPDMELAVNTYNNRVFNSSNCWSQDAIQAAMLGLANDAKKYVMMKVNALEPEIRFPAFWRPGSDYAPDLDNGGVIANALQYMLVNNVDEQIHVLPALPETWTVDCKLNVYGRTTVRLKGKGKQVTDCTVFPATEKGRIVLPHL
ncbi:MAG: hypothetical protein IJ456_04220 [Bacteroides sp.]|nr:hypothetical protein [Bacteroides sp.]